jgi:hypothetical protein
MPSSGALFHSDDWFVVPFSLLWGGFAIFWEAGVLGYWGGDAAKKGHAPGFFILWGIPFVIIGQYLIWGRFLVDAWLKRRTYYAITNRRVLILQEGWKRKVRQIYLESVSEIAREGQDRGTLWLGPKAPIFGSRGSPTRAWSRLSVDAAVPVLADIEELDSVYRLIQEMRERVRQRSRRDDRGFS